MLTKQRLSKKYLMFVKEFLICSVYKYLLYTWGVDSVMWLKSKMFHKEWNKVLDIFQSNLYLYLLYITFLKKCDLFNILIND